MGRYKARPGSTFFKMWKYQVNNIAENFGGLKYSGKFAIPTKKGV
jgi:hypothetical protein